MRIADERGYSLMEVTFVTAILAVVVAGITTLFTSGTNAQGQLNQRFQAQNAARVAFDRLRRDAVCAGSATSTGTAATLIVNTGCVSAGAITWCTAAVGGSTSRYRLFRLLGASTADCPTLGRVYADWLTTGSVFAYQFPSDESLAKLRVELPMQVEEMQAPYVLCDVLVLRNSLREGSPVPQVATC